MTKTKEKRYEKISEWEPISAFIFLAGVSYLALLFLLIIEIIRNIDNLSIFICVTLLIILYLLIILIVCIMEGILLERVYWREIK